MKTMDKLWYLKRCDLFRGLDKFAMDKVAAIAHERTVPKKKIIFMPEDESGVMFILKKGRVRISKLSSEGKMMTLVILKDGDIFGAMSTIKGGIFGAYAETVEDSYICAIQQDDFSGLVKEMPNLALSLIEKINQKLKEAEDRIADLVFRDVPGRIASILLKLAEQFGTPTADGTQIVFKMTHQDLADMVGASRETVTIILNDFQDDKVIEKNERYITITDEQALKQWAGKE